MRNSRVWILVICQVILSLVHPLLIPAVQANGGPLFKTILKASPDQQRHVPAGNLRLPDQGQEDHTERESPAAEAGDDVPPLMESAIFYLISPLNSLQFSGYYSNGYRHTLFEIHTPPPEQ